MLKYHLYLYYLTLHFTHCGKAFVEPRECCECVQVLGSAPARSSTLSRLLKCAAVALIVGALVMLCASVGAFYQWKVSDKNVSVWRGVHCTIFQHYIPH